MTFLFFYILYFLVSYCLHRIAAKLGEKKLWMAWVPIAQELLVIKLAEKKWNWIFWLLIPIVNIWISWQLWSKIAVKLGRSVWLGRLMIIPFVNFAALLFLGLDLKIADIMRLLRIKNHEVEPIEESAIKSN